MRCLGRVLVLVVATMLVAALGRALACSCLWGGPFTKVALHTDLVVLGAVRSHDRHSVDVTIIEVLRGTEARQTIRICGDFWLEARGDAAVGRITVAEDGRTMESAPLVDVLAWVRSGGATALPAPQRLTR